MLLLVPEQAALQTERRIIAPKDIRGAHRAQVLSFRRLAFRVLESAGETTRRALTEPARAMVLRHLVALRAGDLRYYRRVERLGGFVDQLAATVSELIQEAIEPAELTLAGELVPDDNPIQQAKLHDLRIIYEAYIEYLGDNRLDPSQYLQAARECLQRCSWLGDALVWVDGFASLMHQETLTLIALAKVCGQVEITTLCDPSLCTGPASSTSVSGTRLFSKTLRTYSDLHRSFLDAGIEVDKPLFMRPKRSPRFIRNPALAQVEQDFGTVGSGISSKTANPAGVEIIELPTRRIEVDYAVSRICHWVQDPDTNYRYRDIAIITRDLAPYHDLLASALSSRGIPFFIDRRRPVAHHPLVELLRAAIAVVSRDFSLDSVRLLLKTGLLPISSEQTDELENYCLAHGISTMEQWQGDDWTFLPRSGFVEDTARTSARERDQGELDSAMLQRVNSARKTLMDGLGEWIATASRQTPRTGSAWSAAILALVDRLGIAEHLSLWAATAEADGDMDQAEEHRQVWRDTASFVDDLGFALAEKELTVDDLGDVLEAGLSNLTLGLAPPMLDQVLIGSVERSRHPDLKAVILLGFNDGVFPRIPEEDSILSDDDRTLLMQAGLHILPPAQIRAMEESLLVYIAVTRASEALVVTYATADNDGKILRGSPTIGALISACPGLSITRVADPALSRDTWDILAPCDLMGRVAMEFSDRPDVGTDQTDIRTIWNDLYESIRHDIIEGTPPHSAVRGLTEHNSAILSPDSVSLVHPHTLTTSVSQLESYATCPFQHFTRYDLRLKERETSSLDPMDIGQVHHAILEDFVAALARERKGFVQMSDDELLSGLDDSCRQVAARLPSGGDVSNARDAYLLRRSGAQLARILQAQRSVSGAGITRPKQAEVPFGFNVPGSLPALELSTPQGRRVLLRGFIDRVDLAELADDLLGVVVDYKRTPEKTLDLTRVYHGLSLQLIGYLLVLAEHGQSLAGRPIRPVGAFYVSLAPTYEKLDHPGQASGAPLAGTYRPRGLLAAEHFRVFDSCDDSGWSKFYSFFTKTDGTPGSLDRGDGADAHALGAVLDHTRTRLGELADGILNGNISVRPYRLGTFSPCSWCAMVGVCRFEMGLSNTRFLEKLKRSEVFERLTESASRVRSADHSGMTE